MSTPIDITIQDVSKKSWSFKTLTALEEFLEHENNFWQQSRSDISQPHTYFNQGGHIQAALNMIKGWANQIDSWNDQQLQQNIATLQRNNLVPLTSYWLWSGHSYIPTWIDSCKISNNTGTGFLDVIIRNQSNNTNNYEYLKGYLLAYEFQMQGKSEITQRQLAEEKTFEHLRDRLDNKTNELIERVDTFESDFSEFQESTASHTERLSTIKNKLFKRAQKQKQKAFDSFLDNSNQKIVELEKTYQEKLRLEKPATYWQKKASSYQLQGIIWSGIFLLAILIGVEQVAGFFSSWLEGTKVDLELKSLQGVILFMTIITLYAILLKSISKMIFSSFHLQRDAEEREQLTHVYLSLTHEDGKIDEDSRKIVLQALFSRADSGLLHKDSSPTMPGLGELVKASGAR